MNHHSLAMDSDEHCLDGLTIVARFDSKPGNVCIYIIYNYTYSNDNNHYNMQHAYIALMQTKRATNTFILPSINIESEGKATLKQSTFKACNSDIT